LVFNSNSHYETDFGVSSAEGAGNTKIGFLKARRWRAFKKPIFIIRIAAIKWSNYRLKQILIYIFNLRSSNKIYE
jgi:hypothetical protein